MAIDAMNSGLTGIHRGMQGMQKNAEEIVAATTPTAQNDGAGSIEKPAVEMLANQQQVEASAKVVKAQDDMIGTLLDEMA